MNMRSSLQDGQSSLMLASQNGCNEVVTMLLSARAKVNLQKIVSTSSLLGTSYMYLELGFYICLYV